MRRKDEEITDFGAMQEVLAACDYCHLGLLDDQGAYIVPLNFGYEVNGDQLTLYFHTAAEGKMLTLAHQQHTASFEMECRYEVVDVGGHCRYGCRFQSIMGHGQLQIVEDMEGKAHGLTQFMRRFIPDPSWAPKEEQLRRVSILRLDVTDWTCKIH